MSLLNGLKRKRSATMSLIICLIALIYLIGFGLVVVGITHASTTEELVCEPASALLDVDDPANAPSVFGDGFVQVEQHSGDGAPRTILKMSDAVR